MQKLVILIGQEGVGKSTLANAIVKHLQNGAAFDAENILQVNPFEFNEHFLQLARTNSAVLINNFFKFGYETVVAGSFISDSAEYKLFLPLIEYQVNVYVVNLIAEKEQRDTRRLNRSKPTTKESRDFVDSVTPVDTTFKENMANYDYKYLEIDNSNLTIEQTIEMLIKNIPEVFN